MRKSALSALGYFRPLFRTLEPQCSRSGLALCGTARLGVSYYAVCRLFHCSLCGIRVPELPRPDQEQTNGAQDALQTKYYTFISMKIRCETYQTWWLRWRETPWRRPVGLHSTTSFSASAKWPRTKIVQKSPKFQHKCLTVEWEHTQILYYSWGYTSLRFSPSMPTI